ncbi:MAG: AbgT family transporter [Planctomycetota bacterium]
MHDTDPQPGAARGRLLDRIERLGNALPEPVTLFALGTVVVLLVSWLAASQGWRSVLTGADGAPVLDEVARDLASADGVRWLATNLVSIFVGFRPLGLVLTIVLGIAVAERAGLIATALKATLLVVPAWLLTPATFFAGVMSSLAADAGFVVLPPLAAAVYRAAGRAPLAGIATVFAGIASGFNANLLVTGLDPLLAGMTEEAAHILDPSYVVNPACNWWFMIASTFLVTAVGWAVSAQIVEPRLALRAPEEGGPDPLHRGDGAPVRLTAAERAGLGWAALALVGALAFLGVNAAFPWGFLYDAPPAAGAAPSSPTWVTVLVPMLVFLFFVPGIAYGMRAGTVRSDRDVTRMMGESMSLMSSYIVLAFFASIFVAVFQQSNLGRMLAIEGGLALRAIALPTWGLILGFVLVSALINMFIGSASAKWAMLSTVFVPTFMTVGISPELTQASYRVGDSITNCVAPLNPYMVVLIVFVQQQAKRAGLGTMVAMMAPYAVALGIAWSILLVLWVVLGWPLGLNGPLEYLPLR